MDIPLLDKPSKNAILTSSVLSPFLLGDLWAAFPQAKPAGCWALQAEAVFWTSHHLWEESFSQSGEWSWLVLCMGRNFLTHGVRCTFLSLRPVNHLWPLGQLSYCGSFSPSLQQVQYLYFLLTLHALPKVHSSYRTTSMSHGRSGSLGVLNKLSDTLFYPSILILRLLWM